MKDLRRTGTAMLRWIALLLLMIQSLSDNARQLPAQLTSYRAMLRSIYLGPLGWIISLIMNACAAFKRPFMVYGYKDRPSGKFRKMTRISSSVVLGYSDKISIEDNVWIWHYSIIDGSNGVTIGRGSQIGAWVGIFSHGSQTSIRLLGERYIEIPNDQRIGYTRGSVHIGDYVFIGAGAKIMPGVTIGKGALIAADSIVFGNVPDFGIAKGNPAKISGDVRRMDEKFFDDPIVKNHYFDLDGLTEWRNPDRKSF